MGGGGGRLPPLGLVHLGKRQSGCRAAIYVVCASCAPAVVLRHRIAKNASIFVSFQSTLFGSEPPSEQRTGNPFLVVIGTVPPPRMTPGTSSVELRRQTEPLVSCLPLTPWPQ